MAILARFPRFCWVWNCARVCYLQRCTVFREFKILRDFGGFFVGFELLRSCCLRRRCVLWESCSSMCFVNRFWRLTGSMQLRCAQTQCFAGLEFCRMTHHYCALLQILRRPGEAGFTDSLVAHLDNWDAHFGDWRSMVVYEWAILRTISRIKLVWTNEKILSPRVCGFVRLRHSQPNSNFYFLMPLRTSAIEGVLVKVTTINALAQKRK